MELNDSGEIFNLVYEDIKVCDIIFDDIEKYQEGILISGQINSGHYFDLYILSNNDLSFRFNFLCDESFVIRYHQEQKIFERLVSRKLKYDKNDFKETSGRLLAHILNEISDYYEYNGSFY